MPSPDPASPAPVLRLLTLGGAELVAPGRTAGGVIFGPGKPVALLAYLAASPGLAARREHLIDLLWADVEPDAGRHALRQTIWYIRQRAGDLLDATRDSVRLRAPIPSDRDDLLAAVERQDCDAVVGIYLGDFLPNIALPGGGAFEQWADLERQRLRSAYLRCGEAVARRMLSSARHREAIALARRLLESDPASEHVWRLLVEAQLSANDLLGAASEADALSRFLVSEGREPEPATRALMRRATSVPDSDDPPAPHVVATEMIGRAEEFKRLVTAWDDARAGRFRHIHIVAPSGIGKSRILSDFAARLRAKGARVVSVRLRPGDRSLPQSAAGDIAAALATLPGAAGISTGAARSIVALHPALSSQYSAEPDLSLGDEGVRRRTVALHELVAAVADDAPLCLIVDDLHWIDDVSRRMLTSVLQRLDGQRVLAVTSTRPRYPGLSAPATEEMLLHPFSAAQVGALIAALGSLPDEEWAARFPELLHGSTGGSPLLILETLQLLLERELLRLAGAWSTADPSGLERALGAGKALTARIAQLEPVERATLLDLSVAGVPLPYDVGALVALEQRGLAIRLPDGWAPAHDAIGEAAIATATADELRATQLRLGEAWLDAPGAGPGELRRAALQFAAAGDTARVRAAFVRWVRARRRQGDNRSLPVLAEEFAPEEGGSLAGELVASAPLSLRFPRRLAWAGAAVAAVTIAAVGFAARRSAPPAPPDAVLTAVVSGEESAFRMDLRSADFSGTHPFELARLPRVPMPPVNATARLSPDGRYWAMDSVFADSGGHDLALVDARSGAIRRLTRQQGDDNMPTWSPDGRQLAYTSSGRHPKHHHALMVLEVETGRSRQLTFGDESDFSPAWHPSGTQLAFVRRYWTERPDDVCLVSASGVMLDCIPLTGRSQAAVVGWYDHRRVVVRSLTNADSPGALALLNVATREVHDLGGLLAESAVMSGDGQWIACSCRPPGASAQPPRWHVFPTARPDLARQVMFSLVDERAVGVLWASAHPAAGMVSAVALDAPRVISVNAPARLQATGLTTSGQRVADLPVRWTIMDSAIASIDPVAAVVTPLRTGTARVLVDLGGWRSAETRVEIVAPEARTLLTESWSDDPAARFVHFGDPRPVPVQLPGVGTALAINGDSAYSSGIYSRQAMDATRGLGAEVLVSARLTEPQWQNLAVNLMVLADSALSRWDHVHGWLPMDRARARPECYFTIPLSEGPRALRGFTVQTPDSAARLPLTERLRSGQPFRLRLQLFPDGACGLAIDGRVVAWLPGRPVRDAKYRLVLHGYSAGTTIAAGPIEIWSGVKPDMDWRR